VALILVEKLFLNRRHASFLEVLVHVNVGVVLPLVIFQLILVSTSLASAVIFGTGNISLLVVTVGIHRFYFLFWESQINYTKIPFFKFFI